MRHSIFTLLVLTFTLPAWSATYTIDKDHSSITFSIRHLVSKVKGQFHDYEGKINFDEKSTKNASAEVTIKTASIDTGVDKRDTHLKSGDFFDVSKFPTMTFKTTKVSGSAKNLKIEGVLNLHGVEKPLTLKGEFTGIAKDPWGNMRAGFAANGKLNRKDFGLTWNKALETGGALVGDEVDMNFEIEAIQDKADAANVAKAEDKAEAKPAKK